MYESRWKGIKIVIKVLKWNGSHNEGAKNIFHIRSAHFGVNSTYQFGLTFGLLYFEV
jgi:hypothetical protein